MAVTQKSSMLQVSRYLLLLASLLFVSCKSNLSVLVGGGSAKKNVELDTPFLTDEGQLQVSMRSKTGPGVSSLFRLKLTTLPVAFHNLSFQDEGALSYASLQLTDATKKKETAALVNTAEKVADLRGEESFLESGLEIGAYYIYSIKEKAEPSYYLIVQVKFGNVEAVSGKANAEAGTFDVSWSEVPGALTYEVTREGNNSYVSSPIITIDPFDDSEDYEICIRALRGELQSPDCVPYRKPATTTRVKAIFVSSPIADGAYKSGSIIPITVQYSAAVTVEEGGSPAIILAVDGAQQVAEYVSGSGTDTLSFSYTVPASTNAADLEAVKLIDLDGFISVVDTKGLAVSRVLPTQASGQSLAAQKAIVIDTTAPSRPSNIAFDGPVLVSLASPLTWTASTDANFKTHQLKLCTSADCSAGCLPSLESLASPATVNGADGGSYFACVRGEDAAGNLSAWVATPASSIVDTNAAQILSVSSSDADGHYKVGDSLSLSVQFSENVTVTNATDVGLILETGSSDRTATYTSGSGSNTLLFTYTIQAGDTSEDLNYSASTSLNLGPTGMIRKVSTGTQAATTLPLLTAATSLGSQKNLVVDTTAPTAVNTVGFAGTHSSALSFPMSFSGSVDTHLLSHVLKICTASDCSTGCTSVASSLPSPQTMTGVNGATYYGCVRAVDVAGNFSPWVSSLASITVDTTAATVGNVTSSTADGHYKEANTLALDIQFSEPVFVTNSANLRFQLETGSNDTSAVYTSGSGTNTLTFTYTVQAGDVTTLLEAHSTAALTLGTTGTIKDAAGIDAIRGLPPLAGAQSLSGQKSFTIDTTVPTAPSAVAFPGSHWANTGFNVSWTDSSDTNFRRHNVKLCSAADCSTSCSAVTYKNFSPAALSAAAGAAYYACIQGEDQASNVSAWVPSTSSMTVDTTLPTVTSVNTSLTNGQYNEGEVIPVSVTFSEAVFVTNSANLGLLMETGGTDRTATYASGSGTATLIFNYTVAAGDISPLLEVENTSALTLGASATIKDAAGNAAILNLPPPADPTSLSGQKSLVIDTTDPAAPTTVAFASPYSSTAAVNTSFVASTDTNFRFHKAKLCASNDCFTSCVGDTTGTSSPISLTGVHGSTYYACIQGEDFAGNQTSWVASAGTVTIDTAVPSVTDVSSSTADGDYTIGDAVNVTLTFSEAVTVAGGSVGILLETGATDRTASYTSGSGSNTLLFTYTVQAGDSSIDLNVEAAGTIILGGGTIRDAAGNNAILTLPTSGGNSLAGQKAILVDTTDPTAPSSIAFTGTSSASTTVALSWTLSNDTRLSTHNVKLCPSNDCTTNCTSHSTSATSPLNLVGTANTSAYACVQGQDHAGNTSAWIASASPIIIDTVPPTVSFVSSAIANNSYNQNDVITVDVHFSEAIYVTNDAALALKLETGGVDDSSTYSTGHGTHTLTFTYTIAASRTSSDLNYFDTASLTVGAGTIKDAAGNDANLTLPATTAAESLAGQKDIIIDTTDPTAPSSVAFVDTHSSSLNLPITWTASTDINFAHHEARACTNADCVNGCSSTTTAHAPPATISVSTSGTYHACLKALDTAGNSSAWVPSAGTIVVDNGPPTITSVSSSKPDGHYKAGDTIPITVTFSEPVFVVNSSEFGLTVETGTTDRTASYTSGSATTALTFTYTVLAGDTASDLDLTVAAPLTLGTGTIRDSSGNQATLSFPTPGDTGSLGSARALVIDTTTPAAPSSVGWAEGATQNFSPQLSWVIGSDTNFKTHNARVCTNADCVTGCTSDTNATGANVSLSTVAGTSYYGCVRSEDYAGNVSAWINSVTALAIDVTPPTVTNVSSSIADGYYTSAAVMTVDVTFNEIVYVTTPAQFALTLDLGSSRTASYTSGDASNTLRFSYTIAPTDTSGDLEVTGTNALSIGSGLIRDAALNDATLTLPTSGGTSLSGQKAIVVDTTAPGVPSAVAFSSASTPSTSFAMQWTNGADSNFRYHNVKICESNDCSTDCTSTGTSLASPASMTGSHSTSYYGCVQSQDQVGLTSAWVPSSSVITVLAAPSFAGVASGDVLGSWDDGSAKLELTFASAPSGPISKYKVYFSATASPDWTALSPIATINFGDSTYDSNSADTKLLVSVPMAILDDGYYHVKYEPLAGGPVDTNTVQSSIVHVLKGQANYQLIPRKFSGLSYDYWMMEYESGATGSFGADAVTTSEADIARCSYEFHVNKVGAHSSCGTKASTGHLVSQANITPANSYTWHRGFFGCRNASTADAMIRMPTYEEWKRAARNISSSYTSLETTYTNGTGNNCNLGASSIATGARSACKSTIGLYDVAGNNTEFVDMRIGRYDLSAAGLSRFSYGPTISRQIPNGIDNHSFMINDKDPGANGMVLLMGGHSNIYSGNIGTHEYSWWDTQATIGDRIVTRCLGFRSTNMPTMEQLALPDQAKYSTTDYSGAASSWKIPENMFAGNNKPEELTITVNGNTADSVAEGTITLSWQPWTKKVCNASGSCSSSDNGLTYKVYRFLEPNRMSNRFEVPWALGGSVYVNDKPMDPLAIDSDFDPLYTADTTHARIVGTVSNCDSSNLAACTFTDSSGNGTGFSTRKLYWYMLVVEDMNGNAIYPVVRRYRPVWYLGQHAYQAMMNHRWEPRFRRASVFLVDEAHQQAQTIPQIMVHVPMDKSGISYDYYIHKYEMSSYSGSIANQSPAGSEHWPTQGAGGTTWSEKAARCDEEFLKTGSLDPRYCGDGVSALNNTTTIVQSKQGTSPLGLADQGAMFKACRNTTFADANGNTYGLRLSTDLQTFKASDWGDVDQDGTIDQNTYTGAVTVSSLESGPSDTITVRCHSDANPGGAYNSGAAETASCRSRYGAADLIGNVWERTLGQSSGDGTYYRDDGVDGTLWNLPVLTTSSSNGGGYNAMRWDLMRGVNYTDASGIGATIFDNLDNYNYNATGEDGLVRGGAFGENSGAGRFNLSTTRHVSYTPTWIGGRCSFSQ